VALRRLRRALRRRRPRVICTIAMGPHLELLELSEPAMRHYAGRHGYDLVVEHTSQAPERPVSWSKVPLIRRLMTLYDLIVWIDSDAMVVDPSRDIADELVSGADLYIAVHHYDGQEIPNAGILMVRSTPAAEDFMDLVWRQERYIDHAWWENAAILDLLGYDLSPCNPARPSPHRALFRYLGTEWNSITLDPSSEPVIRHYAGTAHEDRLAGMRADARALQLDGHLPLEAAEEAEAQRQHDDAADPAVEPIRERRPGAEEHDLLD
jgi:hypothetical protein